jgi:hypothetical protein
MLAQKKLPHPPGETWEFIVLNATGRPRHMIAGSVSNAVMFGTPSIPAAFVPGVFINGWTPPASIAASGPATQTGIRKNDHRLAYFGT